MGEGTISIHVLREEGDVLAVTPGRKSPISIHALREEGDSAKAYSRVIPGSISIHALREEGDCGCVSPATRANNFYPRPPRGGRRAPQALPLLLNNFYPRPPRGGRPVSALICGFPHKKFLSTPSARRATNHPPGNGQPRKNFYPRPPRGGRRRFLRP